MNAHRRYAQSQNETASKERLMVLLFEAALRHMRTAASALDAGRTADATLELARATDIVVELDATFDRKAAPDLGENLGEIYRFVCRRLMQGNLQHSAELVREAERAFAPVADGFAGAVASLGATGAGR